MRISDWSSDVCSSDLRVQAPYDTTGPAGIHGRRSRTPVHRSVRAVAAPLPERGGRRAWECPADAVCPCLSGRSAERRVGKSVSVRVDLGGRSIIKKKNEQHSRDLYSNIYTQ